jgi:hypothetical protein
MVVAAAVSGSLPCIGFSSSARRADSQGRRARQEENTVRVNRRAATQGALALGALGVVFGDIGTSPLYTVQTVFNPGDPHPVTVTEDSIFADQ